MAHGRGDHMGGNQAEWKVDDGHGEYEVEE
jgi:hypothetical protein